MKEKIRKENRWEGREAGRTGEEDGNSEKYQGSKAGSSGEKESLLSVRLASLFTYMTSASPPDFPGC